VASSRPAAAPPPGRAAAGRHRRSRVPPVLARVAEAVAIALLAILGLGSGLSAIADGYYDLTVWGPITVAMLALALAGAAVAPDRPRLVPAVALGSLVALWGWSRLSASWAESADQALVVTGRWALYAAMLAALVLLMRTRRDRWLPLAFATAGVMIVAAYVLLRMLEGDVESLFFGGRLRDPLGYANGQAGYFLLGFWPCVALAEQTRSKALAGLGAGCAVALGALLILSQTRGVLPAVVASGLVVMLLVPGRPRRVWALAAIGLGLAAIAGPLLDVYSEVPDGRPADPQLVEDAARLVLLAAALVGLGWAAAQGVLERFGRGAAMGGVVRRGEAVLAAGAVVVGLGAAVAVVGDPVDEVREQYDDFVNLRTESPGDSRFLSGGGYRYDYWRVAWLEFEREPLRGLGAGNYDRLYFTERRTSEDIRQPHSLPLQTLAELGLVGGLLLLAFVGAVLAGFWRLSRRGRQSLRRRTLAVAAGGAFVAWLAHTSVDWLHNIPGVTGIAMCAAAALVAPWSRRPRGGGLTSARIVALAVVAVLAVTAADWVGRLALADQDRIEARDSLGSDPLEALRLSNESLALNDESVPALYVKGAAYARLGRYRTARSVLEEAIALEPHDHLTWALLGDLEARRGKFRAARRSYRRSLDLNPRNPFVPDLVRDPRSAVGAGG
jgi:O-Antigen ligase/Tetratricopeptide repeat